MTDIPKSIRIVGLIGWLMLTFVAAAVGSAASAESGLFYQQISRPEWAPPGWLFAPVWTILYILMGISAWIVWRVDGFRSAYIALSLFIIQLVLNALWTWIFFVWKQGALAFVEILVLWAMILCTTIAFWRVRALAGILLIPYLAWVSFASVLAFTVWRLNPVLLA
jgi:benzodiazapine receptor